MASYEPPWKKLKRMRENAKFLPLWNNPGMFILVFKCIFIINKYGNNF